MECIAACPDTALPNTAQDIDNVLLTAVRNYVTDVGEREKFVAAVPQIEPKIRATMIEKSKAKEALPFKDIVRQEVSVLENISAEAQEQLFSAIDVLPLAYTKTNAIFSNIEKKNAGAGGLFSIFVSDLLQRMWRMRHRMWEPRKRSRWSPTARSSMPITERPMPFSTYSPILSKSIWGLYDGESPQDSRQAVLRNHLMVRRNYEALVSGDGACAGCGEKSILRALASITEAYLRPLYHAKGGPSA